METLNLYPDLDDKALLAALGAAVERERGRTVEVLRLLGEVDERRAMLPLAYSSTFAYCVKVLGYCEYAAYLRIGAARAAREYPELLGRIERGEITLTAAGRLAPHLEPETARETLDWAAGKTTREVRRRVAALKPKPDLPDRVRRVAPEPPPSWCPAPAPAPAAPTFPAPPVRQPDRAPAQSAEDVDRVAPRSAGRSEVRFCADDAFVSLLDRARAVLWHKHPEGRLEEVLATALDDCLERRDPARRIERRRGRAAKRAAPPA